MRNKIKALISPVILKFRAFKHRKNLRALRAIGAGKAFNIRDLKPEHLVALSLVRVQEQMINAYARRISHTQKLTQNSMLHAYKSALTDVIDGLLPLPVPVDGRQ